MRIASTSMNFCSPNIVTVKTEEKSTNVSVVTLG